MQVGYKYRLFGEDAEVASSLCNIFSYPDRNFMTASVPVHRLHVYVRRLVEAGYKVTLTPSTLQDLNAVVGGTAPSGFYAASNVMNISPFSAIAISIAGPVSTQQGGSVLAAGGHCEAD